MRNILFAILILLPSAVRAQRVSLALDNVAMPEALLRLSGMTRRYTINFIYNDLEDFRITTTIKGLTITDAIRQIIGFYPISATMVGDSIINVECNQKASLRYKGRIVDASGRPVEFANISLLSPRDSTILAGGVSNASGYFVVPCEARKVIARISYVGYKNVERTSATTNLGTIHLIADHLKLKEVKVVADRIIRKGDHQMMLLTKENEQFGTNALDAVSSLPLFITSINEKDLLSYDRKTVYILINGVPSTGLELRSYSGKDIKRVDYYPTAPAQYMVLTDGPVANIIVRRRHDRQYSGYLNTSNSVTTGFGDNQAELTYSDSLNQVKVGYNMDYRNIKDIANTNQYSYSSTDAATYIGKDNTYTGEWHNISASYQRYQSKSFFNARLYGIFSDGKEGGPRLLSALSDGMTQNGMGSHQLKDRTNSTTLDVYYSYSFKPQKRLVLNVVNTFGLSYSRATETMATESPSDYNYSLLSSVDNRSYSLIANARYASKLWGGDFSVGARYAYSRLAQTYLGEKFTPHSHNGFIYLYGAWSWKVISLVPQIGLTLRKQKSIETVRTDVLPYIRLYGDWWPEGKLKGASAQLTLTLRSQSPSLSNLTGAMTRLTPWLVSTGNPNLKSYWTSTAKLVLLYFPPKTKNKVVLIVQPSYTRNRIATTIFKPNDDKRYYIQPQDIGGDFECMTYMSFSYWPFKWLEISPYLECFVSRFDTPSEKVRFHYVRYGGQMDFHFEDLSLILAYNSPTKRYDGDLLTHGSIQYSATCQYKFKNLSVGMAYNYLGQDNYTKATVGSFGYYTRSDWKPLRYMVRLTATYAFSVGRSRRHDYRRINESSGNESGLGRFNTPKSPE